MAGCKLGGVERSYHLFTMAGVALARFVGVVQANAHDQLEFAPGESVLFARFKLMVNEFIDETFAYSELSARKIKWTAEFYAPVLARHGLVVEDGVVRGLGMKPLCKLRT